MARGSSDILDALHKQLGERGDLWGRVGITGCECLGPCFDGPNLVVYPDGIWYAGVTVGDVPAIVAHLAGGPVVERLVYDWSDDD